MFNITKLPQIGRLVTKIFCADHADHDQTAVLLRRLGAKPLAIKGNCAAERNAKATGAYKPCFAAR
jgi:hypothetical protein